MSGNKNRSSNSSIKKQNPLFVYQSMFKKLFANMLWDIKKDSVSLLFLYYDVRIKRSFKYSEPADLHILQFPDYLFKFHKVRSFYKNGISILYNFFQICKQTFSVRFINYFQFRIGLLCFLCHLFTKISGTDKHINIAFAGKVYARNYTPLLSRENYLKGNAESRKISPVEMMTALLESDGVTVEEIEQLQKLLDKKRAELENK